MDIEYTNSNKSLWRAIHSQLGNPQRDLEDSWLGCWRIVLLGDRLDCKNLNTVLKELAGSPVIIANLWEVTEVDIG
ncbi:hypothetical protein COLO4_33342 [Corchorus olitorius]|uniref:Uncharacterized protein n=1 Tax=Corchorus olitorius TaxID=93759 RepID=A0A1R3GUI7_9ROSI|nr:hypothetical protein COLO4_33342 [Corchorus olitorius]